MTYRLDAAWPATAHSAAEFLEALAHEVKAYATTGREWRWTHCCGRPVHILVSRQGTASAKCWRCLREEPRTPPSAMLPSPRLLLWALSLTAAPWVGRYRENPVRRRRFLARYPVPCAACEGTGAVDVNGGELCDACDGLCVPAGRRARRRSVRCSPYYVAESYSLCEGCKREQLICDLSDNCKPGHDEDLYEAHPG